MIYLMGRLNINSAWDFESHTSMVQENTVGKIVFKQKMPSPFASSSSAKAARHLGETSIDINTVTPLKTDNASTTTLPKDFARLALPNAKAKESMLENVRTLMTRNWKLKSPKVILSFVGGQKDIRLDANIATAFRDGIINLIKRKSHIWLFSGGTNTGKSLSGLRIIDENQEFSV